MSEIVARQSPLGDTRRVNDFVDPKHRGVNLPSGFKDLNDVLAAKKAIRVSSSATSYSGGIEKFSINGLTDVAEWVRRLLESKSKSVWLTFFPKRGEMQLMLHRWKDSCRAVFVLAPNEEGHEKRVREIFAGFGIVPFLDTMATENAKRVVSYLMPDSFAEFSKIITELLRQAYGVSDNDSLTVIFTGR